MNSKTQSHHAPSCLNPLVYEVYDNVAIRSQKNVGDEDRLGDEYYFERKELVSCDLRQPSRHPGSINGPFLRMAAGISGWLFEFKFGERVARRVPTEEGLWAFEVQNAPAGIALRCHPNDSQREVMHFKPQVSYPPGHILFCDLRVRNSKHFEFYRVQGTDGWVFPYRENNDGSIDTMMKPLNWETAVNAAQLSEVPKQSLDIHSIRRLATEHDLVTLSWNQQSRVISFGKHVDSDWVRINVYYTTGTVGTALDHPNQGRTQLFRRNCTMDEIGNIMANPRWHSGRGYKRCRSMIDLASESNSENETKALRESLQTLNKSIEQLVEDRDEIISRINEVDDERLEKAKKLITQEKERVQGLAQLKLGDTITSLICNSEQIDLDGKNCRIIAMGGECTVSVDRNNVLHKTRGMPSKLGGCFRTERNRPIQVLTMGTRGQFYVKFRDGMEKWDCINDDFDDVISSVDDIYCVAFGGEGHLESYVVLHGKGKAWNGNIPNRLNAILQSNNDVHQVRLGPNREWFVSFRNGNTAGGGYGPALTADLARLRKRNVHIRDMLFGDDDAYIIRYSEDYSGPY